MKTLFYKEFKLSIHPLCYVFVLLFSLLGLIPSYPSTISYIYTIASYTFLFLGANKATTTNDLFYSLNLPIRRKDVVKARMISISFLQLLATIPLLICLFIRQTFITNAIVADGGETLLTIDAPQLLAYLGIVAFTFSIVDLIYVPWFYKTGKSIIGPTLVSALVSGGLFIGIPTILAYIPNVLDMLTIGHENANYFLQVGILLFGALCYVGSRILITKLAANNLEKLDY